MNQQTNFRRVYQAMPDGSAVATTQLQCQNSGVTQNAPFTAKTVRSMPVNQAISSGFPVIPANAKSNTTMQNAPNTIDHVENQFGSPALARREFMQGAGLTRTYQISFTNGSGADQTAWIGDANTIAYQSAGGTPLPGSVTIGGTWGANSLAIWKLVTGFTPVRVNKIRINFDTTSYTASANLIGYKTRPDAVDSTDNYNLSTWISPDQYQSLIIENPTELRIVFDASYGLSTLVPSGRTVTFTFYYVSVADVHNMRMVNS